ncbi:putative reverse transcriptase domain-containing protein [Tanacetum coccineum]
MRCGSGLRKGLYLICASRYGNNPNPNSLNDSPNISENVPQSPPHVDHHCCYGCGDSLDDIFYQQCTCESCENGAHYGYNCLPKVPTISNPEPCNNQTIDELLQTLPSFDLTCYSGDGNSFTYDSNLNFVDDSPNPPPQPPMYSCEFCGNNAHYGYDCPPQNFLNDSQQLPPQEMSIQDMEDLKQQYLDEMKSLINEIQIKDYHNEKIDIQYRMECEIKIGELKQNFNGMSIEIRKKEKELLQQDQTAYVKTSQRFNFIDEDDDDEYSFATQEYLKKFSSAITPELPKSDYLIMEDKHLDTIPETESDEFIKFSVENLVQNPSESEDEGECDMPDYDDSQTTNFSTFSNPLFDDSTSSDDESSHEEVIHEISFKTYSNPLFDLDEEIISSKFNPIHNEDLDSTPKNNRFDTESYLLESLLNRDTLMASSPKINSLLDEFVGELKTIPQGIVNTDYEEYISLMERLLYDNSSPRPPEDFHANPNTIIESLLTFPIPVKDSDSLREEIDIFPGPDDSIPPGIESDDFDSEDDNNSTSLPEFDSFHVDYPDSGDSTIDVVEDIPVDVPNILAPPPAIQLDFNFIPSHIDLESDPDVSSPSGDRNKIYDPGICIEVESTRFLAPLSPVIDTLLPFSSENKDKVFNHGVLAYKEKSPPSSSHRGLKAFQLSPESPMMIHGDNTPNFGSLSSCSSSTFYPLDKLKKRISDKRKKNQAKTDKTEHEMEEREKDKNKQEHEEHLKLILELLNKEELYVNFSKCEFWIPKVQFLGHVIDSKGIHVGPAKIESIKDWTSPKTPTVIHQFLGLAVYYRRFIEGFSKIVKSMAKLTQKKVKFDWGDKQEAAFQLLKQKLCSAPILALPEGAESFIVYCDASHKGLGDVLMQNEKCTVFTDNKSLQHILDQKELNLRQRHWLEFLSDYDCVRYHPGKANIVAGTLSRKERVKPLRIRALVMTIGLDLPKKILEAQTEAIKLENLEAEDVGGVICRAMV